MQHFLKTERKDKILDVLIKVERQDGWEVVNWQSPFNSKEEEMFTCDFVPFQSFSSGKEGEMCVHSFRDVVSDAIRSGKRWNDCNNLPMLWKSVTKEEDALSGVYIEIGANIGSCVMEMLLGTDANVIAFEPHPMNLYALKKSISKLDESYQNRIRLFPVGLGDKKEVNNIYSASDNMGNSAIGKIIHDYGGQSFDEKLQFQIRVERLDSLINTSMKTVNLVKMDAQGFECRVLEGWSGLGGEKSVSQKIKVVKFEMAKHWLDSQECTDLVPRFINYGYLVFKEFDENGFKNLLPESEYGIGGIVDFYAVDNKEANA